MIPDERLQELQERLDGLKSPSESSERERELLDEVFRLKHSLEKIEEKKTAREIRRPRYATNDPGLSIGATAANWSRENIATPSVESTPPSNPATVDNFTSSIQAFTASLEGSSEAIEIAEEAFSTLIASSPGGIDEIEEFAEEWLIDEIEE